MDDAMSTLTSKDIRSLRRRYAAVPEAIAWIDAQTPSIEPRRPAGTGAIRRGRGGIGRRITLEAAALELARQARDDARSVEAKPAAKPLETTEAKPLETTEAKPLETTAVKPDAKPAAKRRTRKSSKPRRRKAAATRPLSPGELALAELRSRRGKHAATLS
jgi:hypothetical protein